MKKICILAAVFHIAGCGSNDPLRDARREAQMQASIDETYVYIEANQLEPLGHLRFRDPFKFSYHNDKFVTVDTNTGPVLVEMRRICPDLGRREVYIDMADIRSNNNALRVGVDTIRGCVIENIYKLPPGALESPAAGATGEENEQEPQE